MNATSHDTEFLLEALRTARKETLTSLSQVITLCHLSMKDDGDYPTRIAEAAGVSPAAITGIIDVLVRSEFIERETEDTDRRTRRVRITDKGLGVLAKMLP